MIQHPLTRMSIDVRIEALGPEEHYTYSGEARMTQEQQDHYKHLIGDGRARIGVHADLAEKDYGSGGGITVTVSLTCDQSEPIVKQAIALAHQIAEGAAWYYQAQLKEKLLRNGILK